jgi:2-polyprenyl-6-methoxyphenol hydroxylase-like FAD-dependent oxidoreductase
MDVAVIGGGIGGLSLALQLERVGIDCRVYESVPAYSTLGVGFNLFPHAVRRLHDLGLEDALRLVAVEQQEYAFFTRHGQRVYSEPCGRRAGYDVPHRSPSWHTPAALNGATFPATLTTTALDRSSSRWFATSACTAAAESHQTQRPSSSISCTAPNPAT